jgi:hypothetical protein
MNTSFILGSVALVAVDLWIFFQFIRTLKLVSKAERRIWAELNTMVK